MQQVENQKLIKTPSIMYTVNGVICISTLQFSFISCIMSNLPYFSSCVLSQDVCQYYFVYSNNLNKSQTTLCWVLEFEVIWPEVLKESLNLMFKKVWELYFHIKTLYIIYTVKSCLIFPVVCCLKMCQYCFLQ